MARIPLTELRGKISQAIEERHYDDASAMVRLILQTYPKSALAQRLLGEALWEGGQPEQAAEAFERALQYDPEDFVAYAGLGLIAEQQGALERAIAQVQRAAELAPNSEEVRSELVRLHERRGSADTARLKITRAALGRIYARSEMPSRAVSEFRAVLDDQPDRLDVRLALAEVLWRDQQMEEARREAETVLQYLPDCLKTQLILAAVAKAEGREQNAQELLAEAVAIDPLGECAERLFGAESPLPPSDPLIEVPGYLLGQQERGAEEPRLDIDLPEWLREEPPGEAVASAQPPLEPEAPSREAVTGPVAAVLSDDWLDDLRRSLPPEELGPEAESGVLPPLGEPPAADAAARAWRAYQGSDLAGALAIYQRLVEAEQQLDDTIQALTVIVADTADVDATELLGDAHMRAGHYRAALDSYQRALERLQRKP